MTSSRVHPFHDAGLGNTSYLIDAGGGVAFVVDPVRDPAAYLDEARRRDLRIVATLETHLHADFISGAREVAGATDADIYIADDASPAWPHTGVRDGARMHIGDATIEIIGTPGHTPEHVSYLVTSGGPPMLFSGGSMIVGGAARTDLSGAERTDELSRAQWASLLRLAALADDTILYPTHGAGSFCSTGPARSAASTIGEERRTNPLLSAPDEDSFVRRLRAGFGPYPRYFLSLRDANRSGLPLLSSLPPVARIEAAAAAAAAAAAGGIMLIDGRGIAEWARAHPAGAVSIAVRPEFSSWLGWVVPFGDPFILIADEVQAAAAIRAARGIGYDRIDGWLTFESWVAAGLPVEGGEIVDADEAARRGETGMPLIDVRTPAEFASGHVPGALHLDAGDIIAGAVPDAPDVVVYCGHGERSTTAASLLTIRGIRAASMDGGTGAWTRTGRSLTASA